MTENFTFDKFIANRWSEARTELDNISPQFVLSMQTMSNAQTFQLVIPSGIPEPEKKLSLAWSEVLESTFDVTQAAERIDITLDLLEKCSDYRLSRYHYEVWVQSMYGLIEKTETLIAHTCKVHSINKKEKQRYYALIKELKDGIENRRTHIVHGANRPAGDATPISPTVFTDKEMWEYAVFIGPRVINNTIQSAHQGGRFPVEDYYPFLRDLTKRHLKTLGDALEVLDSDIMPGSSVPEG